jgi:hypothetical protein
MPDLNEQFVAIISGINKRAPTQHCSGGEHLE